MNDVRGAGGTAAARRAPGPADVLPGMDSAGAHGGRGAEVAAAAPAAPRPDGLAALPRRVPQTSLAVELREDASVAGADEGAEEFTADHAASSLAGFQRGTQRARDEDDLLDGPEDPQDPTTGSAASDVPKEATAYGIDPLDTPEDRTAESSAATGDTAPDDPLHAPQDPAVAARGPHTDRS